MIEIKIDNSRYWLGIEIDTTVEWQWCNEHFGRIHNNKDPNYWQGGIGWFDMTFRFNNPIHATMFSLRFS